MKTTFEQYFQNTTPQQRVEQAIAAFQAGEAAILLDDIDRENEADLICSASQLSLPLMAMLIRECSGIVCLCLSAERARQLQLPAMVADNQSRYGTAFTVSIEAALGVTTGVSAADRLATISAAIHPAAVPDDLARPGHVFPLVENPAGLHGRRGHTEGALALSRRADCGDSAVLCELMMPDGTMMRGQDLIDFAQRHRLPILSIEDLVQSVAEVV
ncbi:3,4-dihydroxy-2-butanone-4-phosphate synthase [Chitinibacter fontanus]|uniref:3,4-dihydroxy-2-butanone 4-phosphate synthase n=1 Tax=Chitinibacter fontanus TaxID=1737446 RepID=A0A7D5VAX6_9NEIS|nr:3,4-dihydroxy-2-butanone-4-phosphate synthase [Chitinibacter fontanus]QLI82415.1 3,4-dihydroxy-2-butanone-4-phosphate synthase [Chitinibacter fontanus]